MPNSLASSSWLPPAITPMAQNVDTLFYIMLAVVTFFFILVEVLLVTFLIRYRRTKRNQVGHNVHGNNKFEVIWTAIPALILVIMGAYSVHYVYALQTPKTPQYVIKVTGHEWYWEFQYPNGLDTQNVLKLPENQNVLFDITSGDVIHGFYIPDVRIQQDAVPGRQTQFWVDVTAKAGTTFLIPCDQYCGQGHAKMIGHGEVMSNTAFQQWMASQLKQQQANS